MVEYACAALRHCAIAHCFRRRVGKRRATTARRPWQSPEYAPMKTPPKLIVRLALASVAALCIVATQVVADPNGIMPDLATCSYICSDGYDLAFQCSSGGCCFFVSGSGVDGFCCPSGCPASEKDAWSTCTFVASHGIAY